jgi:uncharacterized protein YecT (DUF1311 family)
MLNKQENDQQIVEEYKNELAKVNRAYNHLNSELQSLEKEKLAWNDEKIGLEMQIQALQVSQRVRPLDLALHILSQCHRRMNGG